MNSIVAILLVLTSIFLLISTESAQLDLEQIDPDGYVRTAPFNQATRNWLAEKPEEIHEPEHRIVSGHPAEKGAAPYLVLIQYKDMKHWCGGAIYNTRTIVTAAHCFYGGATPKVLRVTDLRFIVGELDLNVIDYTEMRRLGLKVTIHPKYDPNGFVNDIAIVQLYEPIRYTYTVQPIPIATPEQTPPKGRLFIGGFGYTAKRTNNDEVHKHHFSSTLNVAEVKVLSRDECKSKFEYFTQVLNVVKHSSIFCAEGEVKHDKAVDACQGDSGGPAVCLDSNNKKYLCGIVNTGMGCGIPGYPGIYSDVSHFHDWIRKVAETPGDPPTRNY